jgi:hypothetical protein
LHELLKNTLQIAAELVRMAMFHQKRRSIPPERKSWRGEEERQKQLRERWKPNPKNLITVNFKEIKRVNLYILVGTRDVWTQSARVQPAHAPLMFLPGFGCTYESIDARFLSKKIK